jgi:hypothetical protein
MTKDQAIAIKVRVDTAMMALREAWAKLPMVEGDDDNEVVTDGLEEALQAAETAQKRLNTIIGI